MRDLTPAAESEQFTVTLAGDGGTFTAAPGERLLAAARRAGRWLPYECGWGSCGSCKATLVSGTTELLEPDAPAVSERDARRGRILLCQSAATSDVTLRPLRVAAEPVAERPTRDLVGRLVQSDELGPGIRRFVLSLSSPDAGAVVAHYRPGQYAILDLGPGRGSDGAGADRDVAAGTGIAAAVDFGRLRRCYSMAGLPGSDRVEFVAKHYPGRPGSSALFALNPGDEIAMELPYGDMWLRDSDSPLLLIAGGTGISAILSILRQLSGTADPRQVWLVYGAGSAAELVCWDDVRAAAATLPAVSLHPCLLRPEPGWPEGTGLVTDALADLVGGGGAGSGSPGDSVRKVDVATCDVYLAGPPVMVSAVQALLDGLGHQRHRRFVDSFG